MAISVSGNVVTVNLNLGRLSIKGRNFNNTLIIGDSQIIGLSERIRSYTSLEGVTADFGTTTSEYAAASLYFQQVPQPVGLSIGRWVRLATSGTLIGSVLTAAQIAALATFAITTNSTIMTLTVDGSNLTITSGANVQPTNPTPAQFATFVATCITTNVATSGKLTFTWSGTRFVITSATVGNSSSIANIATPMYQALLATLGLDAASAVYVPGSAAETALQAITACADKTPNWYASAFAASVTPSDADYLSIASYINGLGTSRIFGLTLQDANILSSTVTNDLPSQLVALKYRRVLWQYSNSSTGNKNAVVSLLARATTIDFSAQNSTITLALKAEPGVVAEDLSQSQSNTVTVQKNGNVYEVFDNSAYGIWQGKMVSGEWIDEVVNLDWLVNQLQSAAFNALYTSPTKIPQTDAGANQIKNTLEAVCQSAVNNGIIGTGLVWNGNSFGQLTSGQVLASGFYIYIAPYSSQSQADREARLCPPIQIGVKLAGAIQAINITLNVNR